MLFFSSAEGWGFLLTSAYDPLLVAKVKTIEGRIWHPFHLAEERQASASTLNGAINALKFYYGTVLKKKFIYEVKRPRKDKKLPIVLSRDEVRYKRHSRIHLQIGGIYDTVRNKQDRPPCRFAA